MDDLLIFGAVILFCGLVVGPLVAIAALRRSAAVRGTGGFAASG